MKLLPGAAERGQPSHAPAQVVERAGVGACGIHSTHRITALGTNPPQPEARQEKGSRHPEVLVPASSHTYLSSRRLPPHSRGNSSSVP